MQIETEGLVLKQLKTVNGRRIITLFTKKQGKISAGTSINEKGKTKASLALRPFTFGKYNINKYKENYNINSAETIKSYYGIGENIDKYFPSAFVLEVVDKILLENQPNPQIFNLLEDFLREMEKRERKQDVLVYAFLTKVLKILGIMPNLTCCVECERTEDLLYFSVPDGGLLCSQCGRKVYDSKGPKPLIFQTNFDIVNVMLYFANNPLESLQRLALKEEVSTSIQKILMSYYEHHLNIANLKSENVFLNK